MAGDWMKIELELPEKPEVHHIASIIDEKPETVVGRLIKVWAWFDKHTENGHADRVTLATMDHISGVTGFGEAMQLAGWLEQHGSELIMPKFDRHTSESAKKRALAQKRKSRQRHADDVTETGPEKRREEKILKPKAAAQAPFVLPDWVPLENWKGFVEMRTKSKTAFTERAKALLVSHLFELVEAGGNAAAILDQSTENGWKGVFPVKPKSVNGIASGPSWWASNEGIQAKAVELGIEPRKGEGWNDLKARVSAKLEAH